MTVENHTIKRVVRLAQDVLRTSDKESSVPQGPWMERELSIDGSDDLTWLFLSGEAIQLYFEALDALENDPAFKHLTRRDLDTGLADLMYDLVINRERMNRSRVRRERIECFLSVLARPLVPYEIAFNVEGIKFGSNPLTIGNVVFQEFGPEMVKDWNYAKAEGPIQESIREMLGNITGQPVGIVTIHAASAGKAVDRAQEDFERALNTLRVCIGSFPWPVVPDQELLQRRGRFCVVRQLKPEARPVQVGEGGSFRRIDRDLAGPLEESTKSFIEQLAPLYDGTIRCRLRDTLLHSIEWIGTSTNREHYDHKIVDLFTALESALTTKKEPRKGEAIVLRSMLLSMAMGDGLFYPGRLLHLYELRSDVIHGAALGVCGKSDYRELWFHAKDIVLNIIRLNSTQGPFARPSQLIKLLESRERIEEVINQLERWQDEATKAMIAYAKSRLQEQEGEPV